MPRQSILVAAEHSALSAFPIEKSELIRPYTFSEQDLSVIKERRGDANRCSAVRSTVSWPSALGGERPSNPFVQHVIRAEVTDRDLRPIPSGSFIRHRVYRHVTCQKAPNDGKM
jgi:Domain of unknown function (DUF4158)